MSTRSPTLETILVVLVVFAIQLIGTLVGVGLELFGLAAPLDHRPWTIVTSVYAHAGLTHLGANVVGLVLFGLLVERGSTRTRFHTFVLTTGAIAGIAEVTIGSLAGVSPLVVGISGAVFALMGYVVSSNPVTETLLGWLDLSVRAQLLLVIVLALGITWVTRGERVAMIAHATGFVLGLAAGRFHLLDA